MTDEQIDVENYTQDESNWNSFANNGRGAYGIKSAPGRIARTVLDRIVSDAKGEIDARGGIDWSQYGEPKVIFDEMLTCQVEWPHARTGAFLRLNQIHFSDETGEILQCGTEYGDLNA